MLKYNFYAIYNILSGCDVVKTQFASSSWHQITYHRDRDDISIVKTVMQCGQTAFSLYLHNVLLQ